MYDSNNIFAKILKKEIGCQPIYENKFALSFYDVHPLAKIHGLVIPKGSYTDVLDFINNSSIEEQIAFAQAIKETCLSLNIQANGFRLISNAKLDAGQEVPHYHVHILAGEKLHAMYK